MTSLFRNIFKILNHRKLQSDHCDLRARAQPVYRHEAGITLIELLIALFIMTLISVATYQATTNAFKLRDRLVQENEFFTQVRLAVALIQRDVTLIYTPLPLVPPKVTVTTNPDDFSSPQTSPDDNLEAGELSTISEYFGSAVHSSGIRPTRFNGNDRELSFVSSAYTRVYRDAKESEFAEVKYELRNDPSPFKADGTQVLMRLIRPTLFDDANKEKPKSYPILSGIRSLKWRYYDSEKERWETTWDNTRADFKNKYPERIELTLELETAQGQKFKGVYQMKSEFPLNGIPNTF